MRRYQRLQRVAAEGPGKGRGDELQVYGDFLRIVLEILNCIIATNLPANPELVYALLHRQEVFMPFRVRCFCRHRNQRSCSVSARGGLC